MTSEAGSQSRVWSWAASEADAEMRRATANRLVGERIRELRYYTLDYRRHELHPGLVDSGPRTITSGSEFSDEYAEPTWRYNGFDALDYGLEVETDSGVVFSLTWDSPGHREGIGLEPIPMLDSGVRSDSDVAIWSVGSHSASWTPMVGHPIKAIDLHYEPWDEADGSQWCRRITIHSEDHQVEIIMGDPDNGALVPSADNVAVIHPGSQLPAWFHP